MRAIYLLILAIVLWSFSCTSSREARQTKRAYKIAAKYGLETTVSVPYSDTVFVPEVKTDTVVDFKEVRVYDSIVVEKERIRLVLKKLPGDSVHFDGTCYADTIVVSDTVFVQVPFISKWDNTKATVITTLTRWWRWLIALIILFIIGSVLWKFRKFIPYIGPLFQ